MSLSDSQLQFLMQRVEPLGDSSRRFNTSLKLLYTSAVLTYLCVFTKKEHAF